MMVGACHRGENKMTLNEGDFGEDAAVRIEKGQGYIRCHEPQRISVLKFCFLFFRRIIICE